MTPRRLPAPWTAEKIAGGYVVRDAKGQALAYVHSRANEADAAGPVVVAIRGGTRISVWRYFPANVEALAKQFQQEVLIDEPFDLDGGPRRGGGTTAVRVSMRSSGLKAWAKPARINPSDEDCAAHEKIAADLGYCLGLPVAPVTLSRKTDGLGLPPVVALSFEALPQGRPWGQAPLTDAIKAHLRPVLSAMFVFHAWIDDHDHDWNDGNVIVEVGPNETASAAFIDYSNSLTKAWKPPVAAPVRNWHSRNGPYNPCDMAAMTQALDRILNLSLGTLRCIVGRIPPECLPPLLGAELCTALDARRGELSKLLNLVGAP